MSISSSSMSQRGKINELFDLIAAFDVIEHLEDDVAAISNIAQMLREDAHLIITVPQHMFLWSRLDELSNISAVFQSELVGKLRQNGFDISYCTSFVFVFVSVDVDCSAVR